METQPQTAIVIGGSMAGSMSARLLTWYMGRLQIAARRDPQVAMAFLMVGSLFAPPSSLLHPRIAGRVLKEKLARPNDGRQERDMSSHRKVAAKLPAV